MNKVLMLMIMLLTSGEAFSAGFLKKRAVLALSEGKNVCVINHYNKVLNVLKPNGESVKVLYFKALWHGERSENKNIRELAASYQALGVCASVIEVDRMTHQLLDELKADANLINKANPIEEEAINYYYSADRDGSVCFLNSYNEEIDEVLDDGSIREISRFRRFLTDKFVDYRRMRDILLHDTYCKKFIAGWPHEKSYQEMFR